MDHYSGTLSLLALLKKFICFYILSSDAVATDQEKFLFSLFAVSEVVWDGFRRARESVSPCRMKQ